MGSGSIAEQDKEAPVLRVEVEVVGVVAEQLGAGLPELIAERKVDLDCQS